ncbi:MAG: polymer-forming cytoskeletal protein [Myxococcota bacterium]
MSDARDRRPESAATNHADGPPLVPSDGLFEGQIAVVGETRIAGAVIGTLRGPGRLRLDPTATIEGPIECEALESAGRIVGSVHARERVRLAAGTHLEGDLEAPVLEVDDDAVWTGKAKIGG